MKLTRTQRFDAWVRRRTIVLMLILAALLLGAITDIRHEVQGVMRWYHEEKNWRDREYEKLTSMRAGFTLQKFEETFGAPVFRLPSRLPSGDKRFVESTFQGRDYWVQVISAHTTGAVLLYSVTSCSTKFNPTFPIGPGAAVTLNKSTLASVTPDLPRLFSDYFLSGATANSYFYDFGYGGNPSNYKSYAWGLNDACLNLPHPGEYVTVSGPGLGMGFGGDGAYQGPTSAGGREVTRFRQRAVVNTYAELAPLLDIREIRPSFQVGVDRILVRTVVPGPTDDLDESEPFASSRVDVEDESLKPPLGRPALREAWGCLLAHVSSYGVWAERETRGTFPMANPHSLIRQASRGFLVVQGPQVTKERWRQEIQIGFERTTRNAARVAKQLRATGVRAARYGKAVLVWRLRPTAVEAESVKRCLPFPVTRARNS
jgi:hypothetical protein